MLGGLIMEMQCLVLCRRRWTAGKGGISGAWPVNKVITDQHLMLLAGS